MNWLDVGLVFVLILVILWGGKLGAIRQLGASIGFFVGFLAATFIASKLALMLPTPTQRILFLIPLGALITFLFFDIGKYASDRLNKKLTRYSQQTLVDKGLGMALAGATCIVGIWMASALLRNVPFAFWVQQMQTSAIISRLDSELPQPPAAITQLGQLMQPHAAPRIFIGGEPVKEIPGLSTPPSDFPAIIKQTETSVVRILGEGCGGITTGSGFVIADRLVMTNAHVVAGITTPYVHDLNGRHVATPIWFDPTLDIALLRVSGLAGNVLPVDVATQRSGATVAMLSFPATSGLTISQGYILENFLATGYDIYDREPAGRQIISLSVDVQSGSSGAPIINTSGAVVGMVTSRSTEHAHTGYALSADQLGSALIAAKTQNQAVSTGKCR